MGRKDVHVGRDRMNRWTRPFEAILAIGVAGLLWALACVPIITIVPATTAMYAVMTSWTLDGPPPVWSTFWGAFKQHFWQALGIGVILEVVAVILAVDVTFGLRAENAPLRTVVLVVAVVLTIGLAGTMVFLFPVMTTYPSPWRRTLRNSALFAAGYVGTTLMGLGVFALATAAIYFAPASLPVTAGLAAYAVTILTKRAFAKYAARQAATEPASAA